VDQGGRYSQTWERELKKTKKGSYWGGKVRERKVRQERLNKIKPRWKVQSNPLVDHGRQTRRRVRNEGLKGYYAEGNLEKNLETHRKRWGAYPEEESCKLSPSRKDHYRLKKNANIAKRIIEYAARFAHRKKRKENRCQLPTKRENAPAPPQTDGGVKG